ncbi:MAG: radical SAM protein [Candidatus Omnitrophota bacterium]
MNLFISILKKVNSFLPERLRQALLPYYRKLFPGVRNVIFLPFLGCNYNCPYCIWNRFTPDNLKSSYRSWQDWVKVFENFPPSVFTITGGEPLLYKDITELIDNFPSKHVISSMVTNLSVNLNRLYAVRNKNFRIMASFHPSMATKEELLSRLKEIHAHGFKNITVNFVAHPKQIALIPELKRYFEKEGLAAFKVDTYKEPGYEYSQKELSLIEEYKKKGFIAPNRTRGYNFNDFSPKKCKAGSGFFIMISNGNVYSCMEGYYYSECLPYQGRADSRDIFRMGNLFDGSFKLRQGDTICHSPCAEICDLELAGAKHLKK